VIISNFNKTFKSDFKKFSYFSIFIDNLTESQILMKNIEQSFTNFFEHAINGYYWAGKIYHEFIFKPRITECHGNEI